ncbi:unnamed protein product [Parascedosporium putredinis]|uniref:Aminoglycoside phosphotransferase domain-containing protein n=1 Tax=Parascedosporium putredinis TaxID=1442378 RepID=A0A9P1GWR7_9PEZI|nr:unnamed protein product [Parascedosporium putredinis]CAI7989795.1 unnamed protein product [Parascedosporium putredinis]
MGFIISRGPESYITGFAHQLFVNSRMTQITMAMASGTPSVLNQPEWKSVPWRKTKKGALDILGDILAEIPGLLVELDGLRTCNEIATWELARCKVVMKCQQLEKEWVEWGATRAPTKSPVILDTVQPAQVMEHFVAAQVMAGYWAMGIFLYAILYLASGVDLQLPITGRIDPREYCGVISSIIPTFLSPEVGEYGIHGPIFPSLVALTYLEEVDGHLASVEACELYAILGQSKRGGHVRNFVDNMMRQLKFRDLEITHFTKLQTLWAGYGHVCAITARAINEEAGQRARLACGQSGVEPDDDSTFRLILKLVAPPAAHASHDEGHLRKMLSYEVEQYFYDQVAPHLTDDVAVARCLASTRDAEGREGARELAGMSAVILTDLRTKFSVMGKAEGFCRQGRFTPRWLWLNGGYTYLATRRTEYDSLRKDPYSDWREPFCATNEPSSRSIAEKAAAFLTPSGRPYESYIHGDVKSENLCTTDSGDQVAFFDFQYVGLGLGVCDLAKLFTCSVPMDLLVGSGRGFPMNLLWAMGRSGCWRCTGRSCYVVPRRNGRAYDWIEFTRHWETALVDWCRFQASWGFWGNTEWLEARVRSILKDEEWLKWLDDELRQH